MALIPSKVRRKKLQFGLLPKRFWISTLIITAAVLGSAAIPLTAETPKPEPDVVKLLPKDGDISGWKVYAGTLVYASGKDLTKIYNGGYELYTKNGVLDAVQQMYRRGDDISVLTVHRMESAKAAKQFYEYWKKTDKKQSTYKVLKTSQEGYSYIAYGTTNGYLYRDRYFVTISVPIDGDKGRSGGEAFLKKISEGVGKLTKPKAQAGTEG